WNALLQINLTGYFLCAQAFGRNMLARGSGVLVHIASIAAGQPQGMSGAYSASKAGVAMLSRQLAFEWGPRGRYCECCRLFSKLPCRLHHRARYRCGWRSLPDAHGLRSTAWICLTLREAGRLIRSLSRTLTHTMTKGER